jgi:hypothetical protein
LPTLNLVSQSLAIFIEFLDDATFGLVGSRQLSDDLTSRILGTREKTARELRQGVLLIVVN